MADFAGQSRTQYGRATRDKGIVGSGCRAGVESVVECWLLRFFHRLVPSNSACRKIMYAALDKPKRRTALQVTRCMLRPCSSLAP